MKSFKRKKNGEGMSKSFDGCPGDDVLIDLIQCTRNEDESKYSYSDAELSTICNEAAL